MSGDKRQHLPTCLKNAHESSSQASPFCFRLKRFFDSVVRLQVLRGNARYQEFCHVRIWQQNKPELSRPRWLNVGMWAWLSIFASLGRWCSVCGVITKYFRERWTISRVAYWETHWFGPSTFGKNSLQAGKTDRTAACQLRKRIVKHLWFIRHHKDIKKNCRQMCFR